MASPIIKLIVNGREYTDIIQIEVEKDIDYISGSFSCVVANNFMSNFPIRVNDKVTVNIAGNDVIYGNVETLDDDIDTRSHSVTITGRDVTADLVRSEIYSNADYSFTDLKSLIEAVMKDNGITNIGVIDESNSEGNDFSEGESQVGETGQTIFDFISDYADKASKVLTSDGKGNVVIYSNSGINKSVVLNNSYDNENRYIKNINYSIDFNDRYKRVIVKSQAEDLSSGGEDITAESIDDEVVRNITKVIISDTVSDKETAQRLADFEVNKRRSDSISYSCTVPSFFNISRIFWEPNLLVAIIDSNTGVNATMLLKGITYKYNLEEGSTSDLVFVSEDTYSLKTQASQFNEGVQ